MAEGILGCSNIDIIKECLDIATLICGVVGHIHVLLMGCLTLDASLFGHNPSTHKT